MYTAQLGLNQPIAVRYPRGRGVTQNWELPYEKIEIGVSQEIKKGTKIAVLSIGHIGNKIMELVKELDVPSAVGHYNMRFVKPMDNGQLIKIFDKYKYIITVEDGCKIGGFGSAILEFANEAGYSNPIQVLGITDKFLEHGSIEELHEQAGIDALSIKRHINKIINAH
ncbi:MAG: transketolase C-terminal domain-containing protein, partial [Maribacter sp.]